MMRIRLIVKMIIMMNLVEISMMMRLIPAGIHPIYLPYTNYIINNKFKSIASHHPFPYSNHTLFYHHHFHHIHLILYHSHHLYFIHVHSRHYTHFHLRHDYLL